MDEFIENYSSTNQIPIIGSVIRTIDKDTEEKGLQQAFLAATKRLAKNFHIFGNEGKTADILANAPLVIAANHTHDLEEIPITASIPRDDIYIIAASEFMSTGANIDKHLIPLFIEHHLEESKKISRKIANLFNLGPKLNLSFEHPRNIESIHNACARVLQGGAVLIFPPGVRSNGKWFDGIGYLLKEIGEKNQAYYLQAYVSGTTSLDIFRVVPGIKHIMPTWSVAFSPPQRISDILTTYNEPKEIVAKLEKDYYQWIKSL